MKLKLRSYFPTVSIITISAVYLLILIGGIVRSTGSGMGCPDWPKCYGQLMPPTDVTQLPENYRDIYADSRHQKNVRMARVLAYLGFEELSFRLVNDEKIRHEAEFNVVKTWIEYINRLVGVVIGLLIFTTFVLSFTYLGNNIIVFISSLAALILVGFQGWLGSIVVSTNLLPGMITVHMLLALVIVAILIYAYFRSDTLRIDRMLISSKVKLLIALSLVLYLLQVAVGTQVREAIDALVIEGIVVDRANWIDNLGLSFYVHRSYSLLILGLNIYIAYLLKKELSLHPSMMKYVTILVVLIGFEILTGAAMAYFAVPAFLQPVHLFVASLIFGLQFYLFCSFSIYKTVSTNKLNLS